MPREAMGLLHEGFDRAISAAIDRYAQRREEVRARFISILGHDLRDPLSAVKISTDALARGGASPEDQQQIFARMGRACDRMQRMIGEVLDFARGHLGGGIPANPTLQDMSEICRHVVDEIAAANPDRTIDVDTRGELRGPFDHDRVAQAIGNLVGNAIEHTREAVEVRAYETEDRTHVITTVTSHGVALPPDVQRRIIAIGGGATPAVLRASRTRRRHARAILPDPTRSRPRTPSRRTHARPRCRGSYRRRRSLRRTDRRAASPPPRARAADASHSRSRRARTSARARPPRA